MIILEGPLGQRLVEEGKPYKLLPGEHIVGSTGRDEERDKLHKLANSHDIGVGDLVAKLTKFFGIAPCAPCEQRRKVLNQLRINNWKVEWDKIKE